MKNKALISLLLFCLAGCASTTGAQYQRPQAQANAATVIVYGTIDSALEDPFLFINDENVGRLNPKGYQKLILTPGEYNFEVRQSNFGRPSKGLKTPEAKSGATFSHAYKIVSLPMKKLSLINGQTRYLKAWSGTTGDIQTRRYGMFSEHIFAYGFYLKEVSRDKAENELQGKRQIVE